MVETLAEVSGSTPTIDWSARRKRNRLRQNHLSAIGLSPRFYPNRHPDAQRDYRQLSVALAKKWESHRCDVTRLLQSICDGSFQKTFRLPAVYRQSEPILHNQERGKEPNSRSQSAAASRSYDQSRSFRPLPLYKSRSRPILRDLVQTERHHLLFVHGPS